MNAGTSSPEWISASEAAKQKPSPHAGKKTHTFTVIRLILAGKVVGRKVNGWWWVQRESWEAFLRGRPADEQAIRPKPFSIRAYRAAQRAAARTLKRHGIAIPQEVA